MLDIINLAFPFFGVIFIGFAFGKLQRVPDEGLAWMNVFILHVALPALFFRILSKTPLEQLAQADFIMATTLATASAFTLAFIVGLILQRGRIGEAILSGVGGGFGNVGYMGPPLALATVGADASVPVALIFCFDALFVFIMVPLLMAFSGTSKLGLGRALLDVVRGIVLNPLLLAAGLGTVAAAFHFEPPVALDRLLQFLYTSAAPCALFALGVTVALRPVDRVFPDVPILAAIKLLIHPVIVLALLLTFGPFHPAWVATAVLMAALPPALTAYVFARQYGIWIEHASSVVLYGTLGSVMTLIVVMWLLKSGTLARLAL
ncbi:MAG TPA: AEC family transporter [Hyphomicrobiaceae bacterium]|jgi:malonate transporter|nr:AEC family transporter [Hyphomicrobiaceae bacterium]